MPRIVIESNICRNDLIHVALRIFRTPRTGENRRGRLPTRLIRGIADFVYVSLYGPSFIRPKIEFSLNSTPRSAILEPKA